MNVKDSVSDAMAESVSRRSSSSTSTISVTASSDRPSLTQAMNAAAKPYHSHLNRSIMARLPLALPPHTSDPIVYAKGIRHMLPIYHTFESAWAKYVSVEPQTPTTEDVSLQQAVLISILTHLNLPQLARADRLRADVTGLLGIGLGELESWVMGVSGVDSLSNSVLYDEREKFQPVEETVEASIAEDDDDDDAALYGSSIFRAPAPEHPALRSFVRHIHYMSRTKPHVLIAYSWVFYMALFNGGRWIRAQLSKARDSWELPPVTSSPEGNTGEADSDETGLTFWYFDGAHDGEDLKDEFKARMKDIEQMLNDDQREDIIQEAVYLFQACSRMVGELDEMMTGPEKHVEEEDITAESEMEESMMIRSELLKPRWEAPWRFLELLFRYLLPLGLFDLLVLMVGFGRRATRHVWPMLRWNWTDAAATAKNK